MTSFVFCMQSHESDKSHLKTLKDRNSHLERDVQKMRERDTILKTVALMRTKLPLAKYSDAKKDFDACKAKEEEAKALYDRMQSENAPLLDKQQ